MNAKGLLVAVAVCFAADSACLAANANMGRWELESRKAQIKQGMAKSMTVTYAPSFPFRVKVTIEGVDAKGAPFHNKWVGRFDGRDYPVSGDPNSDMRSYTKVDDHTLTFLMKKAGRVVATGKIVVAPDGSMRTANAMAVNSKGKMVKSAAVCGLQ